MQKKSERGVIALFGSGDQKRMPRDASPLCCQFWNYLVCTNNSNYCIEDL